MTLTITVSDGAFAVIRAKAEQEGLPAEEFLADRLESAFGDAEPVGHPSEYASEEEFVADAVRKAPAFGVDPDLAAGLAAGLADVAAGRTLSLEEASAEADAALAEWKRTRKRAA